MKGDGDKGFSLIEVLVAFALLALVLTVYLSSTAQGIRTGISVHDRILAGIHGDSIMAQAGISIPLTSSVQGGRLDDRWRWQMTGQEMSSGTVGPKGDLVLMEVTVDILGPDGQRLKRTVTQRLVSKQNGLIP